MLNYTREGFRGLSQGQAIFKWKVKASHSIFSHREHGFVFEPSLSPIGRGHRAHSSIVQMASDALGLRTKA